jgi:trans-aconitate methyltransferase
MNDQAAINRDMQEFFDKLWSQGDFWKFESDEYELNRYAHLMRQISDRRYGRALELGCGAGYFTRQLADVCDRILALDVSAAAIERARTHSADLTSIEFQVANVMEKTWRPDGPWDLIVFNDTIHYLGWKYPFFDVAWLATQINEAMAPGGRLLMANAMYTGDYLLLPSLVRTYRDLFVNVGFKPERENVFSGLKNGVVIEALVSVFAK